MERMRTPFRLPVEQAGRGVVPAGAHGQLPAREVLVREHCRDPSRRLPLVLRKVRRICSLVRPKELVVAARNPRRLAERLKILGPERGIRVGGGEKRERALPFTAAHGRATCLERATRHLSQALVRAYSIALVVPVDND
jgi:hypothetical protein